MLNSVEPRKVLVSGESSAIKLRFGKETKVLHNIYRAMDEITFHKADCTALKS
jgi:hypothetical protein